MLPVSGAEQLNTSGAMGDRPMISHKRSVFEIRQAGAIFALGKKQIPQLLLASLLFQFFDDRRRLPASRRAAQLLLERTPRADRRTRP